jgi:hypothetical protein
MEHVVYYPKKGLIVQTIMSANKMFIFLARFLSKLPLLSKQLLKTTLTYGTANIGSKVSKV